MEKSKKYELLNTIRKIWYYIPEKFNKILVPVLHKKRWKNRVRSVNYSGLSGKKDIALIVSLTSFPARIEYVHIPIESMLMQSVKPDMIILWLAETQFPNKEKDLPQELLDLTQYGLSIEWCDDIRSYKKLVPTIEKYPEAAVITIDDDLYYSPKIIEKLVSSSKLKEKTISCHRAQRIEKAEGDCDIRKFVRKDIWCPYPRPSFLNQLTGGAGTYFPAHSLYKDVVDRKLFMNLAPTNDDIWFWAMAVLGGYRCNVVKRREKFLYPVKNSQHEGIALNHYNNHGSMPVYEQMQNIFNHYPQLIEILNNEWKVVKREGLA